MDSESSHSASRGLLSFYMLLRVIKELVGGTAYLFIMKCRVVFGMLSPVLFKSKWAAEGQAFHSFTETISELLDLRGSLLFHRNTAADTKIDERN